MIQQSQLREAKLFGDLNNLFPEEGIPQEEEQKGFLSPTTAPEVGLLSPALSNKLKRKSFCQTPKSKKGKGGEERNPHQKTGHWCLQENKRYHWFLQIHNNHFLHKHMRRMDKIFKTMALFVGTREAEQCRSHHQKMEKKYHSFTKILLSLRAQHYNSQDQNELLEDLAANQILVIDEILTAHSLTNFHQRQIEDPLWPNLSSGAIPQEGFTLEKEDEDNKSEQLQDLKLMPLNPEGTYLDIVQELLGEVAPHNNFYMI